LNEIKNEFQTTTYEMATEVENHAVCDSDDKTRRRIKTKASLVVSRRCQPPSFTKKLQPLNSRPGKKVRLNCQFQGIPQPTVSWYRNESIINKSERFNLLTKENDSTLEIYQLVEEDSAVYTCRVANEAGSASTTANIIVSGICLLPSTNFSVSMHITKKRGTSKYAAIKQSFLKI
jgi:hypothetical protein